MGCCQKCLKVLSQGLPGGCPTKQWALRAGLDILRPEPPALLTTVHPSAQVPVASWFDNMSDTELHDLLPFFEQLSRVDDVYSVLRQPRPGS